MLRPTGISPRTLAFLLKTDFVITQLMRNNVGIAYPAIDENCLRDVLLPAKKEDLPRLEKQAREIALQEERLYGLRKEFNSAIESAGSAWRNALFTPVAKLRPVNQTMSHRQPRKSGWSGFSRFHRATYSAHFAVEIPFLLKTPVHHLWPRP